MLSDVSVDKTGSTVDGTGVLLGLFVFLLFLGCVTPFGVSMMTDEVEDRTASADRWFFLFEDFIGG